jgi:N-acetyl-gamma-glutamyl-phosphate reductase
MQVRVAVVGATGYTGEEIVSVLSGHDGVKITALTSRTDKPVPYSDMFPRYKGSVDCVLKNLDFDEVASAADVVFLSLPHTVPNSSRRLFLRPGKRSLTLARITGFPKKNSLNGTRLNIRTRLTSDQLFTVFLNCIGRR